MSKLYRECSICAEKKKKYIKCLYCNFESCIDCTKTYVLNSIDPCCMNCKKEWNSEFMISNFTKSFISTELKKHKENILFDKQISFLPGAQRIIEEEKKEYETNVEISNINIQIEKLIKQKREKQRDLVFYKNRIDYMYIHNGDFPESESKEESNSNKFIFRCPVNECRGFLSSRWKCGVCNSWVCAECREIKRSENDEEHKCDPDTLKTIKIMEKEAKNCPKCACLIIKISGCDQMFCTNCHTAFNWKTRKIETKNIHNPHYFEYIRNNGFELINNDDLDYCNIHDNRDIINYLRGKRDDKRYMYLFETYRLCLHISDIEIRNINRKINSNDLVRLRIRYLRKEINEKEFKKRIQMHEKKVMKLQVISDLLNMFVRTSLDIMRRCKQEGTGKTFESIEKIRIYFNECIEDIEKKYDMKLDIINKDMKQVPSRKKENINKKTRERNKINKLKESNKLK